MRKLGVFWMVLLAAMSGMAGAKEHVEVKAVMKGADAEGLANSLRPITNMADLAVVYDGKATIYFDADPSEVAKTLQKARVMLPAAVVITELERSQGGIPDAPEQSDCKITKFQIDRDRASNLGVSLQEVATQIGDLVDGVADAKAAEKINAGFITTARGLKIPMRDLVKVEMVDAKRPLIIRRK